MKGIFSVNSPFVKAMTFIGKLIMLNVCWFLSSLPILTIGASTSAMFAMMIQIVNKQDERVIHDFFVQFKSNFKKATIIFLILLVFGGLVALEIFYAMGGTTVGHRICLYVGVFGAYIFVVISMFVYIVQARFDNNVWTTIKNSILIACLAPFTIFKLLIIWVVPVAVSIVNNQLFANFGFIWLICGTALQFYFSTIVILNIFNKVIMQESE